LPARHQYTPTSPTSSRTILNCTLNPSSPLPLFPTILFRLVMRHKTTLVSKSDGSDLSVLFLRPPLHLPQCHPITGVRCHSVQTLPKYPFFRILFAISFSVPYGLQRGQVNHPSRRPSLVAPLQVVNFFLSASEVG